MECLHSINAIQKPIQNAIQNLISFCRNLYIYVKISFCWIKKIKLQNCKTANKQKKSKFFDIVVCGLNFKGCRSRIRSPESQNVFIAETICIDAIECSM